MTRRYAIIRGRMLDDPVYGLSPAGTEMVTLHVGVRMPMGFAEPVLVQAGDVMPAYCRGVRLAQGDMVVASGWIEPEERTVWPNAMVRTATMHADMVAAGTSMDWRDPS